MSVSFSLEYYANEARLKTRGQGKKINEVLMQMPISRIHLEGGSEIEYMSLTANCPPVPERTKLLELVPEENLVGVYYYTPDPPFNTTFPLKQAGSAIFDRNHCAEFHRVRKIKGVIQTYQLRIYLNKNVKLEERTLN
jgi:hypothetical protein